MAEKKAKKQATKTKSKNPPATNEKGTLKPLQSLKRSAVKAKQRLQENRTSSPHRSFQFTRPSETPDYQKLPAWWRLLARTLGILRREWKKILPLVLIFALIAWLLSGIFNQGFTTVKATLSLFDTESLSIVQEALVLLGGFVTAQAATVPKDALLFLNILGLLLWLSFIWIARYSYARKPTTMREAFYTSGAAIVPFVLLVLLLVLQLLPAAAASIIFSTLQAGGLAQNALEMALFAMLILLLIVLSLYLIIGTVIALQVITLPGMYPWRALRNARKLVANRRFSVLRKLLMLPILILLVWGIIFVPLLLLDSAICQQGACWSTYTLLPLSYYALVALILAFASTYLYVTYRALLEQEDDYI